MMPIGPLMVEHRLIERMIALLDRESRRIRGSGKVDTDFVLTAIDFIRLYADRCHHGKEEDILFRRLKEREMPAPLRRIMEELEEEHAQGRRTVARLALVRERVLRGDAAAPRDLAFLLDELVRFYPQHIRKEDEDFFLPCMELFDEAERQAMLEDFRDFDRTLLHEHYGHLVGTREGAPAAKVQGAGGQAGEAGEPHVCMLCGYVYEPGAGDPAQRIAPGTAFGALPEGWVCPHCHASQRLFIPAGRRPA